MTSPETDVMATRNATRIWKCIACLVGLDCWWFWHAIERATDQMNDCIY